MEPYATLRTNMHARGDLFMSTQLRIIFRSSSAALLDPIVTDHPQPGYLTFGAPVSILPNDDLAALICGRFEALKTGPVIAIHFGVLPSSAARRSVSSPSSMVLPAPSLRRMTLPASSGVTLPSATACKSP